MATLIAVVALFAAACSPSAAPTPEERDSARATTGSITVVPPDTPAGDQLEWLIGALGHLPISDTELGAHFNPGYLATASPAALNQWLEALNEWLQAPTGVNLVSIKVDEPSMVVAIALTAVQARALELGLPSTAGP